MYTNKDLIQTLAILGFNNSQSEILIDNCSWKIQTFVHHYKVVIEKNERCDVVRDFEAEHNFRNQDAIYLKEVRTLKIYEDLYARSLKEVTETLEEDSIILKKSDADKVCNPEITKDWFINLVFFMWFWDQGPLSDYYYFLSLGTNSIKKRGSRVVQNLKIKEQIESNHGNILVFDFKHIQIEPEYWPGIT